MFNLSNIWVFLCCFNFADYKSKFYNYFNVANKKYISENIFHPIYTAHPDLWTTDKLLFFSKNSSNFRLKALPNHGTSNIHTHHVEGGALR